MKPKEIKEDLEEDSKGSKRMRRCERTDEANW